MKKTTITIMVGVFLLSMTMGFAGTASAAPMTCPAMKVMKVGPTSTWLKNVSGAACGAVANGKQISLTFDPNNSDKLLALVLTASSLGKNVWVHAGGDVNGSIVDVISMSN